MPAADGFIIGSYGYRTVSARRGYRRELAKSLQLFAFEQGTDRACGPLSAPEHGSQTIEQEAAAAEMKIGDLCHERGEAAVVNEEEYTAT